MATELIQLGSAFFTGQAKIAITGTAVPLSTASLPTSQGVVVTSISGNNTSGVSVGFGSVNNTRDGTGNGYILAAGNSVTVLVNNASLININGTAGDIVSFMSA